MSTFDVSGKPSYRSNNALGFFLCVTSLTAAEIYIDPLIAQSDCALCTVIRLILLLMSGLFLLSFLINRVYWQRFVAVFHLLLIGSAMVTTLRSLFVTDDNLPDSCSLGSLPHEQGSFDALLTTLHNASVCPYPDWHIYQLSVAHLSLILMLILLIIVWKIVIKKPQKNLFF